MNLKDRMKKEMPEAGPAMTGTEATPSADTTPKSKQASPERELIEQQSEAIRILQAEMEALKTENGARIQELLSENSDLRKELRRKSATIVSLNDRIGTLSTSDIVLRQNEELRSENAILAKEKLETESYAAVTISAVKAEYKEKEKVLNDHLKSADQKLQEAEKLQKSIEEEIKKEALQITEKASVRLDKQFQRKYSAIRGSLLICLSCCVCVTFFTAIRSERFKIDLLTFFDLLWGILSKPAEIALYAATEAHELQNLIPYETLDVVCAWLVSATVFILIIVLSYGLLLVLIWNLWKIYMRYLLDLPSFMVFLASFAVFVWFADELSGLPCNIVLLWIGIYSLFQGIRLFIHN